MFRSIFRYVFGSKTIITTTLTEARKNAKACYLNEDLEGARRWNEIIAKMISSEKSATTL